jgi:4-oxalocrotonate tautomerase
LASQARNSFWLDIKVTAGTTTKSEIANYIEAVFRSMRGVLGAIHDSSYTVVHEVPAAAWGFAGKTQEYRFVAGKIASAV